MFKKIFVFLVLVMMAFNSVLVLGNDVGEVSSERELEESTDIEKADDKALLELGVLGSDFNSDGFVKREDCIVSVMRLGGIKDGMLVDMYKNVYDLYDIFRDYEEFRSPTASSYADLGVLFHIANGMWKQYYSSDSASDSTWIFEPKRNVTAEECTAFLVRLLEDCDSNWNLDKYFDEAKRLDLVKPEDSFYNTPTADLSYRDFCELLNRMLNRGRYVYFTTPEIRSVSRKGKNYDTEGKITYLEYLKSVKEDTKTDEAKNNDYLEIVINGNSLNGKGEIYGWDNKAQKRNGKPLLIPLCPVLIGLGAEVEVDENNNDINFSYNGREFLCSVEKNGAVDGMMIYEISYNGNEKVLTPIELDPNGAMGMYAVGYLDGIFISKTNAEYLLNNLGCEMKINDEFDRVTITSSSITD